MIKVKCLAVVVAALAIFNNCSKKEEKAPQTEAPSQPSTEDSSYDETLTEMKEHCLASPSFFHFGKQDGVSVPVYSGYADGEIFQFELGINVRCHSKFQDDELANLVGESRVTQIKLDLENWSSEQDWFASRTIQPSVDDSRLEIVSSQKVSKLRWELVLRSKSAGNSEISLSTSDGIVIESYPVVIAAYTSEAIAAGEDLFANREHAEGTCVSCHTDDGIGPILNGKYINVCSDDETLGAILNGVYAETGGFCSGNGLPDLVSHAFSASLSPEEALNIIAWIRSQ